MYAASMAKKNSTGALTEEQKKAQNDRYAQNHEYDYVIVGTGNAALTIGCLLVNAGYKICMLEAHDIPGGCAHSFRMADCYFCAHVHYVWGCAPGARIYEFLRKIGLEQDIEFEPMDTDGFDHMVMPDGKRIKIPNGFEKLIDNIEEAYPGNRKGLEKLFRILQTIREDKRHLPKRKDQIWRFIPKLWSIRHILKWRFKTQQDLFDHCGISKEAQAVLSANAADLMEPPESLSVIAYASLMTGYNSGAYYPKKHFKYYIERMAQYITDHEGCHIYYEEPVIKMNVEGDQMTSVETATGKVFTAKRFIANLDPKKGSELIGREHFDAKDLDVLDYEYSPSGFVLYLAVKDLDLKKHGFGSFNIWHVQDWDMNTVWNEQKEGKMDRMWVFLSSPSLHSPERGVSPDGVETLQVATYVDYKHFKEAQDKGYKDYNKMKLDITKRLLDFVEEHYIPNIRKHIYLQIAGSPTTTEDFCNAPKGNSYGPRFTPHLTAGRRVSPITKWENFNWCNATSGAPGIFGTAKAAMDLYSMLTGDNFFDESKEPKDEDLVKALFPLAFSCKVSKIVGQ